MRRLIAVLQLRRAEEAALFNCESKLCSEAPGTQPGLVSILAPSKGRGRRATKELRCALIINFNGKGEAESQKWKFQSAFISSGAIRFSHDLLGFFFFAPQLPGMETRAAGCFSGLRERELRAKSRLRRLELPKRDSAARLGRPRGVYFSFQHQLALFSLKLQSVQGESTEER